MFKILINGPLIAACLCGILAGRFAQTASAAKDSPFTHVITADTEYYTSGPQQGRPPDGNLPAGTKVELLREAAAYSQVRTQDGLVAYVATGVLKRAGATESVPITKEVRAVARSSNQFAFDLYGRLRAEPGNLFLSPASISTALAMTYAGAEGQTERQMADVLHLRQPEAQIHAGFGTLSGILNRAHGENYLLKMANRLWGQKGAAFQPDFLSLTGRRYGAELAQVDFRRESEQARRAINEWVAAQTNDKIQNLIPPGVLDSSTQLVLTNAIYFKGAWEHEFSESATTDAPFHLTAGQSVPVAMMRQTDEFRYGETDAAQILELPYAGHDLSMLIVLPKRTDGLADLEAGLSGESFRQWTSGLRRRKVHVEIPKFKLTSQFQLADALRSLGMTLAFSDRADFSGISASDPLQLSEVVHQAFVDVNEKGTEAAAATGAVVAVTAAPVQARPVVFRADHPFVFAIRDNRTDAVLFLGRVQNPKK